MTPGSILLPAAFAGLVAVGVTVAIERWGGRVGGLIGTLPSTIIPASLGIAATSADGDAFARAMFAVPAGMLVNSFFLWSWRALPPRLPPGSVRARAAAMTVGSLAIWLGLAWAMVAALGAFAGSVEAAQAIGIGATVGIVVVGALACLRATASPRGRAPVGPGTLVLRGLLAAFAIGAAVAIASTGSALAAGIASVFPAIFLTTMVSLWLAQGEAVPAGAVGPMMLGSAAVASYALFATATFSALGPAAGALTAWGLAVSTTTLPAWWWLGRSARAAGRAMASPPVDRAAANTNWGTKRGSS